MAVPNIFGSATSAIPLSQLDQNFATAITLGNTAVYLGNTTTSLGNVTLTNVTISSGTSNIAANVSTAVGLLPEAQGGTGTTTGYYGFKNRIINGAMVIDQRNAGASVTITNLVAVTYTLDRWLADITQASKFSVQQNAGSVTPPTGFTNYLGATVGASANVTVGASDYFYLEQKIEGYNVADLAWGTASAATVTLSFWVRSSLTGTFGGAVRNGAGNRSYPFTYTISAANTWEQKSITIAGDTSGTWLTTNGAGLQLAFGIGVGTTYSGTAGAWAAGAFVSATGAVKLIETNSATFYITGVQLEKGSTATSFDYRPYGTELALCQRYYFNLIGSGTANFKALGLGLYYSNTQLQIGVPFPVTMRTTPTSVSASAADSYVIYRNSGSDTFTGWTDSSSTVNFGDLYATSGVSGTAGQSGTVGTNSASSFLAFNAEL